MSENIDRRSKRERHAAYLQTARRIFTTYMLRFRPSVIAFGIFSCLAALFGILGPRILGLATTRLFQGILGMADGTADSVDLPYIAAVGVTLLCLYSACYFCQYMQGRLMTRVTNRTTYFVRMDVSKKLNRLPFSELHQHSYAEVLTHVTNDADILAFSLNQIVTQITNTVLTLVGVTIMMFTMNWLLALIVLLLLPAALLVAKCTAHTSQKHYVQLQEDLADLTEYTAHAYERYETTGHRSSPEEEFNVLNERVFQSAVRAQGRSGQLQPAVSLLSGAVYIAVTGLGAAMAATGTLTVGELQAFIQYIRNFTNPVSQLGAVSTSIQHTLAAAQRIFRFLDAPEDAAEPGVLSSPEGSPDVQIQDVSADSPDGMEHLDALSFAVPAGGSVLVTGAPGSGKTLLTQLLARLCDPQKGYIRLGGHDLKEYSREALASVTGTAFREDWSSETDPDPLPVEWFRHKPEDLRAALNSLHADPGLIRRILVWENEPSEPESALSSGERALRRTALLLSSGHQLLILDGTLEALDDRNATKVLAALDALPPTVIATARPERRITGSGRRLHLPGPTSF